MLEKLLRTTCVFVGPFNLGFIGRSQLPDEAIPPYAALPPEHTAICFLLDGYDTRRRPRPWRRRRRPLSTPSNRCRDSSEAPSEHTTKSIEDVQRSSPAAHVRIHQVVNSQLAYQSSNPRRGICCGFATTTRRDYWVQRQR